MDVEYKGKDTIIHNLKDFDLGQTMECGQCFHFQKIDDDEYGMSAYGKFLHAAQKDDKMYLFVKAENERAAAEKTRQENENTRIQQEKQRQQDTSQAVKNAEEATTATKQATKDCKEVTDRAEDALQNQEQLEATLNTATQIRQEVSQMQSAAEAAKKQVEQDKKDIDDTIQNSLLASAEKILESVQDYFNRAEALYSSMYLDCDGETPYLRTVTPIFIDGATPQVRNANEGVDFDGGTPTSRQLAV